MMNAGASTNYSISNRLTRRLTKAFGYWNQSNEEKISLSKLSLKNLEEKKYFSIEELMSQTKFTRTEIQFIYRDFKQKCPRGLLNEKNLIEIYSQYFSCGDCTSYAKHLFSALLQQHYSTTLLNSKDNKLKKSLNFEINFQQFAITLSTIMRGTFDEKIRWLFSFYDLNKDGKISHDEIASMIKSLYDLMGEHVRPKIDDEAKEQHIEAVLKKMGLYDKPDKCITYDEFHQVFVNQNELIDSMMNVF